MFARRARAANSQITVARFVRPPCFTLVLADIAVRRLSSLRAVLTSLETRNRDLHQSRLGQRSKGDQGHQDLRPHLVHQDSDGHLAGIDHGKGGHLLGVEGDMSLPTRSLPPCQAVLQGTKRTATTMNSRQTQPVNSREIRRTR